MNAVHLYGRLGRAFGPLHRFDIETPSEAIRALACAFPGAFESALREGAYRIVRGDRASGSVCDERSLGMMLGGADLHIIPAPAGASRKGGIGKVILGVALLATAAIGAPPGTGALGLNFGAEAFSVAGHAVSWGNLAGMGAAMAISGVSQILSPQVKASSSLETADRRPSFVFSGPVNGIEQGGAVQIVYGRMRIGGTVISASLTVEQTS